MLFASNIIMKVKKYLPFVFLRRLFPIFASGMAQLDYMEKRGGGLSRIRNEIKALEGYKEELQPVFKSSPTQFQTIIYAIVDTQNVGNFVGEPTHHRTRPLYFEENGCFET